jgi:hypothetical protein
MAMLNCLANEQENEAGNAKSQERQKGNNQYAFHGEPPLMLVPNFTNSLSLRKGNNNSAIILSFFWEVRPTDLLLFLLKYCLHPMPWKQHWVNIEAYIPIKKPAGVPAGCEISLRRNYGLMIPFRIA